MGDIHKDIQYDNECDIENDIGNGVRELYRIFKESCYVYNQEFTDIVIKEVNIKSENKNLAQICESIIDIIKSEKK